MGIDKCLTLNPENSLHIHRLKYGMGRPKVAVVAKRRLKALNAAKIDTSQPGLKATSHVLRRRSIH